MCHARAQPLGRSGGPDPPPPKKKNNKIWTDHPNFFDEECDYRYVTDCSARNWAYRPYFVLYNNLDQGTGPPTLKTWLSPWCHGLKAHANLPLLTLRYVHYTHRSLHSIRLRQTIFLFSVTNVWNSLPISVQSSPSRERELLSSHTSTLVSPAKTAERLNRSRCRLGCGLGWAQGIMC